MAAPLVSEFTIKEYIRTFIEHPESLDRDYSSVTPSEMRDIRAGIVEFLEGRPKRQLGGLYDQAYQFAENQADVYEALTPIQSPRMEQEIREDYRRQLPRGHPDYLPPVSATDAGDAGDAGDTGGTTGDGRNYSPPKYRFNRRKC